MLTKDSPLHVQQQLSERPSSVPCPSLFVAVFLL